MDDLSLFVEDNQHGETKSPGVVQSFHQGLSHLPGLVGVVVGMDIDEILLDNGIDGTVIGDEVGKTQAPGAPVAAHLADDELALGPCLNQCLVNLLEGVNLLVIDLFGSSLLLSVSHQ